MVGVGGGKLPFLLDFEASTLELLSQKRLVPPTNNVKATSPSFRDAAGAIPSTRQVVHMSWLHSRERAVAGRSRADTICSISV